MNLNGLNMAVENYEDFKCSVSLISDLLNKQGVFNMVKTRNYADFDWFLASFMVDAFGGDAYMVGCLQGKWYCENFTKGTEREFKDSFGECFDGVSDALVELFKVRNTQELCDFINSQNED